MPVAAGRVGFRPPSMLVLMQVLLKCADISNVVKPVVAAKEWAVAITDEFFAQGDMERSIGIEVCSQRTVVWPCAELNPDCPHSAARQSFHSVHYNCTCIHPPATFSSSLERRLAVLPPTHPRA